MKNLSIVYKITCSAILVAISLVLSRFLAIPLYTVGIPFIKISLATSLIMFSSFYLGPIYGAIIGFSEDLLGSLLVAQGGFYNPLYSISVVLGGLMPYFIYKLTNLIKIEKKFPLILTIVLALISSFITFYCFYPSLGYIKSGSNTYIFDDWLKIILTCLSWGLSSLLIVGCFIIKKYFKNLKFNMFYNIFSISTSIFLTYLIFKVPVSSAVFTLLNGSDATIEYFFIVLVSRLLTAFFTAFIDIIINVILLNVSLLFNYKGALLKENGLWKKKRI